MCPRKRNQSPLAAYKAFFPRLKTPHMFKRNNTYALGTIRPVPDIAPIHNRNLY